ncbi:membrane protein [Allosalinactinospora lopnorensis]|uniref:membrane protein n=1 Tax=Allosalinactinospora lopnorensis TaxID=1352348 RepID=UPI000623E983|nr:membrane protein [Allosalinactinospora lopnorensis]
MTKFFLAAHVLAAIIAVGPVTVAASMFPAAIRRAQAAGPADTASTAPVRVLHRICRVYAAVGLAVPVFGFATASSMGILTDTWLIVSVLLTGIAACVLAFSILPGQDTLLAQLGHQDPPVRRSSTVRLAMFTGLFNVLWAVITILMIVRPGSTTGA